MSVGFLLPRSLRNSYGLLLQLNSTLPEFEGMNANPIVYLCNEQLKSFLQM